MAKEKHKRPQELLEKDGHVLSCLVVEAIIMASVVIINLFMGSPWYVIVNEVIGLAITCGYVILLYDPCYRKLVKHEKLTRTYKASILIFFLSVCLYYTGYKAMKTFSLILLWGLASAVTVLGVVFYYKVVGNEDKIAGSLDRWFWRRKQKVYKKTGMTEAQILEDTKEFCKYHFVGDTLEGDLDLSRPLLDGKHTVDEMKKENGESQMVIGAERYLSQMVHQFCVDKNAKGGK